MKTSEYMISFTVLVAFLFKICLSQGSTVSLQDDHIFNQQCKRTSQHQSVCEKKVSPSLMNDDLIQLRKGDCVESLTCKIEGPKTIKASGTANSMESKTATVHNYKGNLTGSINESRMNVPKNVITLQALFLSKSKQMTNLKPKRNNHSLIGLPKKKMMPSGHRLTWNALIPKVTSISRSKRDVARNPPRRVSTLFGLQESEEIFNADQSLEALLRKLIKDHINGCDLIIVYDEIYKETRTLETLVRFPVVTQVLQLVSLEDLTEKILWDWEWKNCQGTVLLLSDPDVLISFGKINRFFWTYRAKTIIVGLQLHSLEKFLKTVKGRKTEHVIGVVEDPVNHHLHIYMNLLFWGEGMQLLTDWSGNKFTKRANIFPDKTKNLRNATLNAVTFEWRPVMFYEYGPDGSIIRREGRFLSVIRALAEKFNFTLTFREIENEWGQELGNGSFDGLVGYLQRDEGHFGLPYFYHSGLQSRHLALYNSRPIEDDQGCVLVRREPPRPSWEALGLPFTVQSWYAVISGIILSGPIFYLFVMASTVMGEEYENFKSLVYSSLFTIGIQIDHPLVSMPRRICNQIFIVFLLIYSLILSTGYRSNLISFLTVARPPQQIDTFKDLANTGLPVYGLEWFYSAFQVSGDPHLRKILDRYEVRFSLEEFMDEFLEGKVVTVNSKAKLEGMRTLMRTKTGKPLTRFLKECLSTYTGTLGFQWHTPMKTRFNKVIASLVESGIARHWVLELNEEYKKLVDREGGITYYPDIWHDIKDGLIPLNNSHLTGIWAIVAIGYFLGTFSFAVEVIT